MCMDILRKKMQRTVYRMTLVKGFNMETAMAEYARLIAKGLPTFVEIKGVTYAGHDAPLDFSNVPFHEEVRHFCEKLVAYISDDYGLACEHEHSCCMLIAHKSLLRKGKWFTHIDYPQFFKLWEEWRKTGKAFTYEDYALETPSWALYGAKEGGFDPDHTRHRRGKKNERRDIAFKKAMDFIESDTKEFNKAKAATDLQKDYLSAKKKTQPKDDSDEKTVDT